MTLEHKNIKKETIERIFKNIPYNDTINEISIPISNEESNESLNFSFGDNYSAYHAILCGKTGSGKSILLHQIIINGAMKYSHKELEFVLLDLKDGVEFQFYTDLPHVKILAIDEDPEFGFQTLLWLDDEYKRRSSLFKSKSVKDITEYKNAGFELSRIIIIIDEFQKMFTHQGIDRESASLIENFVRQFRSVGMHLLLSTQTPNSVNWKETTLEQIAVRMGPAMSKEAEESLFRHRNELIASNYTEKGIAIYNSHSGIASETKEFKYDMINPRDYLDIFKSYYSTAINSGWLDERVIYKKSDYLKVDNNGFTFKPSTENKIVEPIIGYFADISREKCKIPLFDERGRTSNLLILGEGDGKGECKSDVLTEIINSYLVNSDQESKLFIYSESNFYNSLENKEAILIDISNKTEKLHFWINSIFDDFNTKNETRKLLIIDGVEYLDEITDYDENSNDSWGDSENNLDSLKKLSFIINKSKIKNTSIVILSETRNALMNAYKDFNIEDFNYALALKGGDNRINESSWENHDLDENIGLFVNQKQRKSQKINLLKII